jgi:hypothetical protein
MGFQQATIPVQNAEAFSQLKKLIESALDVQRSQQLLAGIVNAGLVVWKFEAVLERSLLEKTVDVASGQGKAWYQQLPMSDQAQIREFYLTHVEQVGGAVRDKYKKAFRYL